MGEKKGATIWARQTLESDIFLYKPDKWFKIWFYIINKVNHKDNKKFKRGECFLTGAQIQENTGATKDQVKKCLAWLRASTMVSTERSTRGMKIKVNKYREYQDFGKYRSTKKALEKHQRSTTINNNGNNDTISKDIDKPQAYGNPNINYLIESLKEINRTSSLDGTIKENRRYAQLLIKTKITPLLEKNGTKVNDEYVKKGITRTLNYLIADDFHKQNATSVKYVYKNFLKIIKK